MGVGIFPLVPRTNLWAGGIGERRGVQLNVTYVESLPLGVYYRQLSMFIVLNYAKMLKVRIKIAFCILQSIDLYSIHVYTAHVYKLVKHLTNKIYMFAIVL